MRKHRLLAVSICIVLALSACSLSTGRKTAFRNTCWGDDIETIKKEENLPIIQSDEFTYRSENQSLAGIDADIGYWIDPEYGLCGGAYYFNVSHSSDAEYVSDFHEVRSFLEEMYGEPDEETEDSESFILIYSATWIDSETNTQIVLLLVGNTFALTYQDINYINKPNKTYEPFK